MYGSSDLFAIFFDSFVNVGGEFREKRAYWLKHTSAKHKEIPEIADFGWLFSMLVIIDLAMNSVHQKSIDYCQNAKNLKIEKNTHNADLNNKLIWYLYGPNLLDH